MARFSFELSCKLFPALAVSSSLYPTSCSFSHLVHVLSVILFHDQTGSKPSTQSPEDLHDGQSWMSATPMFIGKHTFVQKLLTLGQCASAGFLPLWRHHKYSQAIQKTI